MYGTILWLTEQSSPGKCIAMYVDIVANRKSRSAVLLREGGRVRKRTLANLTDWPPEKVEALRRVLRGERLVAPEDAFTVERSAPRGHVEILLTLARRGNQLETLIQIDAPDLPSRRCASAAGKEGPPPSRRPAATKISAHSELAGYLGSYRY